MQKTAYEMRISDWSSDVCSSDLHPALDPFRHELQVVGHLLLEVAVGRAARHGADRAHAAIGLVGAALEQEHLAGALLGAGEERADHGAARARGHRLGEVAGELDAAVGDRKSTRLNSSH